MPKLGRRRADRVLERLPEARPARAAVELRRRTRTDELAARATEHAFAVLVVERARERPLRRCSAQHLNRFGASSCGHSSSVCVTSKASAARAGTSSASRLPLQAQPSNPRICGALHPSSDPSWPKQTGCVPAASVPESSRKVKRSVIVLPAYCTLRVASRHVWRPPHDCLETRSARRRRRRHRRDRCAASAR